MTESTLASVEDYLRYSEKPICEYREGVLHPKPMPTTFHALLEFMLVLLLRKQGVRAVSELTLKLTPSKFLVPDVVAAAQLHTPYPTEPVLLCCEILSPEDRLGSMLNKCEEYHAWGVPHCWVIDPVKRTTWEYHAGEEPVRVTASLKAGKLTILLDELFASLDEAS